MADGTQQIELLLGQRSGAELGPGKDAAIEIEWPSGVRQKLTNVAADKRLVIQEP